ncbi:MAG: hypothetical protein ABIN97_14970 [Ginsengibacter sp.]
MKFVFFFFSCILFFTANLFAQPANDDACGAINIPVNPGDILGQNCTPTTVYSWSAATLTGATPNPSCIATGLSNIRDVWYKLIVPSSGKLQISVKATQAHYLVAYRPALCTATLTFSEIACYAYPGVDAIGIMSLSSLTPSGTIYLRIMRSTNAANPNSSILMCAAGLLNIPVIDNSKRVGIGSSNPLAKLDVVGTAIIRDSLLVSNNIETRGNLKAKTIQLTNGANNGNLLRSDANGNASWVTPSAIGAGVHYIGESYGGGIVFYVYDNGKHGLIAATADANGGNGIRWYGGTYSNTRGRADGIGAGLKNTPIIIANQGPVDGNAFAATVCNEYSITAGGVTYGDWYLPSKYELNLLYLQKSVVGGFIYTIYWSSSEQNDHSAWHQHFGDGFQDYNFKSDAFSVRAVRAF